MVPDSRCWAHVVGMRRLHGGLPGLSVVLWFWEENTTGSG